VAAFLRRVSSKVAEPPEWAIKSCALRLQELYALCRPKLVVCVGKLAAKHAMPCPLPACLRGARWIEVVHPAAILRADVSQRGLAVQRTVAILADAASDLLDGL
jgi:uracil-DNA glycosylase